MAPEVKLLDRDAAEIEREIAEWVAGTDGTMEGLYELLMMDQDLAVDDDAGGDEKEETSPPASSRASQLVNDTIYGLEVMPLNLKRIMSWCQVEASAAGYEALLTSFQTLLTEEQKERYRSEAARLFIPAVVEEWL